MGVRMAARAEITKALQSGMKSFLKRGKTVSDVKNNTSTGWLPADSPIPHQYGVMYQKVAQRGKGDKHMPQAFAASFAGLVNKTLSDTFELIHIFQLHQGRMINPHGSKHFGFFTKLLQVPIDMESWMSDYGACTLSKGKEIDDHFIVFARHPMMISTPLDYSQFQATAPVLFYMAAAPARFSILSCPFTYKTKIDVGNLSPNVAMYSYAYWTDYELDLDNSFGLDIPHEQTPTDRDWETEC